MPTPTKAELLQQKKDKRDRAMAIKDTAEREGRVLNESEDKAVTQLMDEFTEIGNSINRLDKQSRLGEFFGDGADLNDVDPAPQGRKGGRGTTSNPMARRKAFQWIPKQEDGGGKHFKVQTRRIPRGSTAPKGYNATGEYRQAFNKYIREGRTKDLNATVFRTSDDERAGYFVLPEQMSAEMLKNADDAVFIQSMATVIPVTGPDSLGIRKRTAKAEMFGWGEELSDATENMEESLRYGKKVLTPHYYTGAIDLSNDLLRRSTVDIEGMIRDEVEIHRREFLEQAYLYGDGRQKPLGLMTASNDGISTGRDVTTSAATSFDWPDFVRLLYSLKPGYRTGASWMFHTNIIRDIALLKDDNNVPLYMINVRDNIPSRLLGLPVAESYWMPSTVAASSYWGLLGNFSRYYIAWGMDVMVQRLLEMRAHVNQTRLLFRGRLDGLPVLEEAFVRPKAAAA